jgi:uncharacterized protein YdaU (DUF1376 family)
MGLSCPQFKLHCWFLRLPEPLKPSLNIQRILKKIAVAAMNFYKRFMADYAKKTSRLTLAQHGAYTLLLDEMYSTEQPLPSDVSELFRICRAMTKDEQNAVRQVADKYFPIGEYAVRDNPRASKEIELASPSMEAARLNGKKGGRPGKQPIGCEINNPVGFESVTQLVRVGKAPHSSEEYIEAKASLSPSSTDQENKIPDCPYDALIDLYEKNLPGLSQPRKSLWKSGKNAPAMKSRWRWVMTSCHESGSRKGDRLATTPTEGLDWFDRMFSYVAKSDWLTGKSDSWQCDLGWLVNAANFEKVLQGNYENKASAA